MTTISAEWMQQQDIAAWQTGGQKTQQISLPQHQGVHDAETRSPLAALAPGAAPYALCCRTPHQVEEPACNFSATRVASGML